MSYEVMGCFQLLRRLGKITALSNSGFSLKLVELAVIDGAIIFPTLLTMFEDVLYTDFGCDQIDLKNSMV